MTVIKIECHIPMHVLFTTFTELVTMPCSYGMYLNNRASAWHGLPVTPVSIQHCCKCTVEINCGISISVWGHSGLFSETSTVFTEDQCELGAPLKHCLFFPRWSTNSDETQGDTCIKGQEMSRCM